MDPSRGRDGGASEVPPTPPGSRALARRRLPAFPALVLGLLVARSAIAAGPDAPDALFDKGVEQMEAGQFDKACPAIALSYKLDPLPGTLFTLAECENKLGKTATALGHYQDYLTVYGRLPPEKKRKQGDREKVSKEAVGTLSKQVPEVTITLAAGAPPATVVTRDGEPYPETQLGVPVHLDPGDHVFVTQAPGGTRAETVVTVKAMDRKAVVLEVAAGVATAPKPSATPAPEETASGPSGRHIGAIAAVSVGAAGLLVGAVTGGLALGKKSAVNQGCGIGGDPTACNATGFGAANSLKTLGAVSTAGFVVGGVAAAAGIVLFATEPKAKAATATRGRLGVGVSLRGVVAEGAW
jgi:hypothetical protein